MQDKATDLQKNKGYDIADFLILNNYKEYIATKQSINNTFLPEHTLSENLEQEIKEIESILKSIVIPDHPVELKYYIIQYPKNFIDQYLAAVKEFAGNPVFLKYLKMIQEFIQVISNNYSLRGTGVC
ncbi:MAG: hypothetical protein IPH57_17385 [Saprospiraceae bacterium]|nr:hypothetical protein [Saprospiraceae bacterium]